MNILVIKIRPMTANDLASFSNEELERMANFYSHEPKNEQARRFMEDCRIEIERRKNELSKNELRNDRTGS